MHQPNIFKPDQYHHENKSWVRMLEYFKQENTYLKTRLSEVLDHISDKEFFALAEQFQNRFILKDEYISELRHDIRLHDLEISRREQFPEENELALKQDKLRHEMQYFEKDFNFMKNEFNSYLSSGL